MAELLESRIPVKYKFFKGNLANKGGIKLSMLRRVEGNNKLAESFQNVAQVPTALNALRAGRTSADGTVLAMASIRDRQLAVGCSHFTRSSRVDRDEHALAAVAALAEQEPWAGAQYKVLLGDTGFHMESDAMADKGDYMKKRRIDLVNDLIKESGRTKIFNADASTHEGQDGSVFSRHKFECNVPGNNGPGYGPTAGRTPGAAECVKWSENKGDKNYAAACFFGGAPPKEEPKTLQHVISKPVKFTVPLEQRLTEPLQEDREEFGTLKGSTELRFGYPDRVCWANKKPLVPDPAALSSEDKRERWQVIEEFKKNLHCFRVEHQTGLETVIGNDRIPVMLYMTLQASEDCVRMGKVEYWGIKIE